MVQLPPTGMSSTLRRVQRTFALTTSAHIPQLIKDGHSINQRDTSAGSKQTRHKCERSHGAHWDQNTTTK
eukprot:1602611-Amphidinium_carterae.2